VYSLFIKTRVKPGCANDFLAAIKVNAAASVASEPGCLVFDVSQDRVDPDVIYLYEIYRDEDPCQANTQTAHFRNSHPLIEPLIVEQECFESDVLARNPVY